MKATTLIFGIMTIPILLLANNWEFSTSNDAMTGEKSAYAFSPSVSSNNKMDFPYSGTKSWVGVGCKDGRQWAYFGFSIAPNLNDTETQDGYSTLITRIKFGNELNNIKLTQEWGAKALHLSYPENKDTFIEKLKKVDSVLLELNWHGNGKTYFKYPLRGSSNAISNMQDNCGLTKVIQEREKKEKQRKIKARKQEKLWEDKRERLCNFKVNTTRIDIENSLDIKLPDHLTDCKVYSSTSTVCKYREKNVLGNDKAELIRKYGNNPKVCFESDTKKCVTYIFKNNKLDRVTGCMNEKLDTVGVEEKKKRCIEETGSWKFGDNSEIICGHDKRN